MKMNNASKEYYKTLKYLLTSHSKSERILLKTIQSRIYDLNTSFPNISYEDLCEHLGTPVDIITEHFSNMDPVSLSNKLRISRYIRTTLVTLLITALILSGVYTVVLIRAYHAVLETNITHEVIYIE